MNISKIDVTGYYAGTNDCPATLPVGANCTFTITFTPTFVVLTGGSVLVYDNAVGSMPARAMEGTGK